MKNEPEFFDLDPNTPFGRSVTLAEFTNMCKTGRLQGEPLKRFWRMNEFNQPMPDYLEIQVLKNEIQALKDA